MKVKCLTNEERSHLWNKIKDLLEARLSQLQEIRRQPRSQAVTRRRVAHTFCCVLSWRGQGQKSLHYMTSVPLDLIFRAHPGGLFNPVDRQTKDCGTYRTHSQKSRPFWCWGEAVGSVFWSCYSSFLKSRSIYDTRWPDKFYLLIKLNTQRQEFLRWLKICLAGIPNRHGI